MVTTGSCLAASAINLPPCLFLLSSRFFASNLQSHKRPMQCRFGCVPILFFPVELGQPIFRAFFGLLRSYYIDFRSELRSWRQYGHNIIQNLGIAPAYCQSRLTSALLVAHLKFRCARREM